MIKAFTVTLRRDGVVAGAIQFPTLLVFSPKDYRCDPPDVLTFEQVRALVSQRLRLPAVLRGAIGEYEWREEK